MKSKIVEQIILDVEVGEYELQILTELELDLENDRVVDYEVWITADRCCGRFLKFGSSDYKSSGSIEQDRKEIMDLVIANYEEDNISFDDIIEYLEEDDD